MGLPASVRASPVSRLPPSHRQQSARRCRGCPASGQGDRCRGERVEVEPLVPISGPGDVPAMAAESQRPLYAGVSGGGAPAARRRVGGPARRPLIPRPACGPRARQRGPCGVEGLGRCAIRYQQTHAPKRTIQVRLAVRGADYQLDTALRASARCFSSHRRALGALRRRRPHRRIRSEAFISSSLPLGAFCASRTAPSYPFSHHGSPPLPWEGVKCVHCVVSIWGEAHVSHCDPEARRRRRLNPPCLAPGACRPGYRAPGRAFPDDADCTARRAATAIYQGVCVGCPSRTRWAAACRDEALRDCRAPRLPSPTGALCRLRMICPPPSRHGAHADAVHRDDRHRCRSNAMVRSELIRL